MIDTLKVPLMQGKITCIMRTVHYTQGITFVEILIASAVMLMLTGTIITTYISYMTAYRNTTHTITASYLLEEGVEAVKTIRDRSWEHEIAPLSTNGTHHHLSFSTTTLRWNTTSTPEYSNDTFKRWFTLETVQRDSNDDIASSGTIDDGSRKLTVTVAWPQGMSTSTKEITTYITDIHSQ